ncbi:MAG: metallophosphoesterase family protein [Alphaproteobacteria bacterium]|jgi:hypothetical protein|nr:metallophosphoesterase family protein [Alphaproteobacteria bacterium]
MEAGKEKHTPDGKKRHRRWSLFKILVAIFGIVLRLCRLHQRGVQNARDITLTRLDLTFDELPAEFDGFKILQLSDLHVDFLPGTTDAAARMVKGVEADLCILSGDYRRRVSGPFRQIMPPLQELVAGVSTRHGVLAVLGNHDCAEMAPALEELGVTVLVNETRSLARGDAQIHLTGTDDVHYYYTAAADAALGATPDGFKIALVHSAELADVAADAGFDLYLAGHTHGGQVCLPGGIPIITHMNRHRGYAAGLWQRGQMLGYSSTGVGVSGLPVRFNSRGEVVLMTLRRTARE